MFMANRVLAVKGVQQGVRNGMRCSLAANQRAYFSEETQQQPAQEEAKAETPASAATEEPTQAEKEANASEWGIKYDDECLKFEKEWQAIAEAVEKESLTYLEGELSDTQKKKVEMLADKVLDLNMFEQRYFHASIAMRVQRVSGMNLMKLNLDWPSLK